MTRIIVLVFLLLLRCPAATYFADNSAIDCGPSSGTYDPGTRSCGAGTNYVFSTAQAAIDLAVAGDIVELRAGTYPEVLASRAAGSSSAYITIRAYRGEQVIIPRFVQTAGASTNHNYQWISGLTFAGAQGGDGNQAGVRLRSSFNVVTNCVFTNILAFKGEKPIALYVTGGFNTIVSNTINPGIAYFGKQTGGSNKLFMTDTNAAMIPGALAGWKVYNWTGHTSGIITANTATTITALLKGGAAFDSDWDQGDRWSAGSMYWIVFAVNGPANTFCGNRISGIVDAERIFNLGNCDSTRIIGNRIQGTRSSNEPNGGPHVDLFQSLRNPGATARYLLIENNLFLDNKCQFSNLEMSPLDQHSWTFRGNVACLQGSQMGPKVARSKYYNNTLYGIGESYPFGCFKDAETEVFNNVFIGTKPTQAELFLLDGTGWPAFSNNYWACTTAYQAFNGTFIPSCVDNHFSVVMLGPQSYDHSSLRICDKASIRGGNPGFKDPALFDFRLQPGSRLTKAGLNLSSIWPGATDMYGVPRRENGAWEIGAFSATP